MNQDEQQLKLLTTFHYVLAGITGFFALLPIIHIVIGLMIIYEPERMQGFQGNGAMPPFFGWFFVIFGALFIILGWTLAILILLTAGFLAKRKNYLFCLVIGGIECLFMPFGTVLGIFTIVVLMRDSVKQLFEVAQAASPVVASSQASGNCP